MFARSVILVEDESQQLFVQGIAPIIAFDLNADGISVIPVDGEDGYGKFFTFLEALAIPYVALKDKNWGNLARYPADRFWSFGGELEDYLDAQGLKELRQAVVTEVGTKDTKARVAAVLPERLSEAQVPQLFRDLLEAARRQATGEPISVSG